MNRTTGQNILSTLDVFQIKKEIDSGKWTIHYKIQRNYIEPFNVIDYLEKSLILNVEDSLTLEGNITSYEALETEALDKAVEHAETNGTFTEYEDNSGDLWEGEGIPEDMPVTAWAPDVEVAAGFLRSYNDVNYFCIQKHTTQASWTPDVVPALWGIVPSSTGGVPVWVQANYSIGDQVHFPTLEDPIYESNIDNNVWSPEGYPAGWDLV